MGPVLRDGDIYFWSWKDTANRFMPYHCRSQIAIVRDGQLVDTFWYDGHDNSVLRLDQIDLVYKGNEAELVKIDRWEVPYYEPSDIVDMSHSNNSGAPVYRQPDAKRSQARIIEHLEYKRDKCESQIRSAQDDISRISEALVRANAGELDGWFP